MSRLSLPIDAVLPQIVESLRQSPSLVLQAPTGAGKTTRVPPALLKAGFAEKGRIVMLEPRRLAARAAAGRMARERSEALGTTVGYHVRFDKKFCDETKILVVTEGLLLRMLHHDPYLESVSVVLFDEFHERNLDTDLSLGLVRLLQQTVRPDLRVVAMSATIAGEALAHYLGDCPIVTSEGRLFPVEVIYDQKSTASWTEAAALGVERLLNKTPGDILVFLPGLREIRKTGRHLEELAQVRDFDVLHLYGDLPAEQQDAALLPGRRRKVVLATNVAETSVTVEGVTGVVDTGLARMQKFDAHVGLDRLELTPISKASADQRLGRAGRTQPGVCLRLWSKANHASRPDHTEPEIQRVDLAGAVLQLLSLGEKEPAKFPWLDAPPPQAIDRAMTLLGELGALEHLKPQDEQRESWGSGSAGSEPPGLTSFVPGLGVVGKALARLPVHPRLGRLLLEGQRLDQPEVAAFAAAFLSERDPFPRFPPDRSRTGFSNSDVLDRLNALLDSEESRNPDTPFGQVRTGAARFIFRARDQLLRELRTVKDALPPADLALPAGDALLRALLAAFPDRVCRRRLPGSPRGRMVGGRGVKLAVTSSVTQGELFLAIDVDGDGQEATVWLASQVEREWLPAENLRTEVEVSYNEATDRVTARHRLCFIDLLLEDSPASLPEEEAARVLAEAALVRWDRVAPGPDTPAGQFLERLRFLRRHLPELGLPAPEPAELREILPYFCTGRRSLADLQKADWQGVLEGRLSYAQKQALDQHAPTHLEVPSGSRLALKYEPDRAPTLAVRIQELYGLAQTPRLAAGRVPILLHLLAPNFRPQQITDDLASFWANTYSVVRKELRGRYPKHSWPEDPLTAPATTGKKRK